MGRSADDFLADASGGDSHEAIKWKDKPVGTTVVGFLIDDPKSVTRPNLNTKEPEEQLPINLDTDGGNETGYRTLWVRKGFLAGAIKDAVEEAGAKGLAKGGKLGVQLTELRDTGKPQPAYVFKAQYTPPVSEGTDVGEIF